MSNHPDSSNQYTWWPSLRHGGLLISPARLAHYFSAEHARLSSYRAGQLRTAVQAQRGSATSSALPLLLDTVLESVLDLAPPQWRKANAVGPEWGHRLISGETLKPRRLWLGDYGSALPLFTDEVKQIGIGTGRRSVSRVVEWLR
jgi:hypothetical protein